MRAAWAVRTLARVAVRIPTQPAAPLHSAPATNASAVQGDESARPSSAYPTSSSTVTTATKTARIVYSRLRKAVAPSAMLAAIARISSVPSSARPTRRAVQNANPSAPSPASAASIRIR